MLSKPKSGEKGCRKGGKSDGEGKVESEWKMEKKKNNEVEARRKKSAS